MEKEVNQVMWHMISKLIRMEKIGGAHTEITNLPKGLPLHFTSNKKGKKIIQKAIKELFNKGYLLQKPSTGEIHVSLNSRKLKEIEEFILKYK
ncbi:MAG: hypothetical protein AABX08_03180 [Nanoarchaeota archaeon]|mgnify:CR=1 FL=1